MQSRLAFCVNPRNQEDGAGGKQDITVMGRGPGAALEVKPAPRDTYPLGGQLPEGVFAGSWPQLQNSKNCC
jgi:hypothetical protein